MIIAESKFKTQLEFLEDELGSLIKSKNEYAIKRIFEISEEIKKIRNGEIENTVFQTHAQVERSHEKTKNGSWHSYNVSFEGYNYVFRFPKSEYNPDMDRKSKIMCANMITGLLKDALGEKGHAIQYH